MIHFTHITGLQSTNNIGKSSTFDVRRIVNCGL